MALSIVWSLAFKTLRSTRSIEKPKEASDENALPDIIFQALNQYSGRMQIVISDRDLTAREFEDEFTYDARQDGHLIIIATSDALDSYVSRPHVFR